MMTASASVTCCTTVSGSLTPIGRPWCNCTWTVMPGRMSLPLILAMSQVCRLLCADETPLRAVAPMPQRPSRLGHCLVIAWSLPGHCLAGATGSGRSTESRSIAAT